MWSHLNEKIGAYRGKLTEFKNGKTTLSQDEIFEIASVLNTSTDYLLGNTDDPSPPGAEGKSIQKSELVNMEDVKAAFFHGADPTLTEEEMESLWEDARNYMMYKISQRSRKNKNES